MRFNLRKQNNILESINRAKALLLQKAAAQQQSSISTHELFDFSNSKSRIQSLWTCSSAVHDSMASVY